MRRIASACMWLTMSALLLAQQTTEFVPQESVPKHEIATGPLLYGAYSVVWAVFVVYVIVLWRRIGRVEHELDDVRQQIRSK